MAALRSATYRVIDEWTAYRIWTLNNELPPKLDTCLTVVKLNDNIHQPIYNKIQEYLLDIEQKTSEYQAAPIIWQRDDYPELFEKLKHPEHRANLKLEMSDQADFRNICLKQITVFLAGATSENSSIYCQLIRSGNRQYISVTGEKFSFILSHRKIPSGYRIVDGKPDFSILKTPLVNHPYDPGYSLYSTYELYVPASMIPNEEGEGFSKGNDYSEISEIHIFPIFFFNSKANEMKRNYKMMLKTLEP